MKLAIQSLDACALVCRDYVGLKLKRSHQKYSGLAILLAALTLFILSGETLLYSPLYAEELSEPDSFVPYDQPPRPINPVVVWVKALVDTNGKVRDARIYKSSAASADFEKQALEAVLKTECKPAVDKDQPVEAWVIYKVGLTLPTQQELTQLTDTLTWTEMESVGRGESLVVEIAPEELFPEPDEFIDFDQAPVQINPVKPVYPEQAKKAKIEGVVWVQALVDKNGKVRDARIYKASGKNVGFEEAAVEAAYKTEYKPAIINNDQPVAVWVVYKVEFTLKGIK